MDLDVTRAEKPFLEVVAAALGVKVTTGGDTFEAEREQWEDGKKRTRFGAGGCDGL